MHWSTPARAAATSATTVTRSRLCSGARDPGNPALALRRAQLLQHKHEFAAAERVLGEILEINGRDREARLMRAQVRLHLHEPQQALADCTALMPLVDLLTSTTCIAQARAALGDLQRAQALLLRVLDYQRGDDCDPQLERGRRGGIRGAARRRERRGTLVSRVLRARSAESLRPHHLRGLAAVGRTLR